MQGAGLRILYPRTAAPAYSVRSATTGSFLAALRDGISPASSVNAMLTITNTSAAGNGKTALKFRIPVSRCKIKLIGIHNR